MRNEEDLHVALDYRIVHEDESFLVVEKPAPLPVHPVGRFKEKNLLSLLKKDFPAVADGLRIVNRLDSETSGLVLVAKSSEMAGKLGILFEERRVEKEYQAVVFGIPDPEEGTIAIKLGTVHRDSQHLRVPDLKGEVAITDYKLVETRGTNAVLNLFPQTGRTHQLRAHLSFIGHPIAGDKIYIDSRIFERYIHEGWQEDMRPVVGVERLLLHATRLAFRHPTTGRDVVFLSQPPECFGASLPEKRPRRKR